MHPSGIRPSSFTHNKKLSRQFLSLARIVLLVLGITGLSAHSYAQKAIQMPGSLGSEVVPNEVIVGVLTAQDDAQEAARLNTIGATVVGHQAELHAYRMRLPAGMSIADAIARLQQRADVSYAEPNHLYHVASTPNDTSYANQYGPQKVQADLAWDIWNPTTPVVLAIVDTGIDGTHPDLVNKMYRNSSGVILGYNSVTGATGNASDDFGHGTHCAGIAAAQINNGVGIAGIAGWKGGTTAGDTTYTKLMPVKVLDSNGNGTDATVADGILWAANNGAKIISMSLGGDDSSSLLNNAVQTAWNKGCVIVAAAGNSGWSNYSYPGAYTNVISVAATDSSDTLANYSNYGSWVKVAAPGSSILSTVPTYQTNGGYGTNYNYLSGTSMATPHVAGEAALILAQNPSLTNSQVSALITSNVDPYTPYYSGGGIAANAGRINIYRALLAAGNARVPNAPTNLVASPGNALVGLAWTASVATTCNVKRSQVSGGPYTAVATGVTTTSYVDTTVTNGATYYYVVTAVSAAGESANSNQVSATPQFQTVAYRIDSGGGAVDTFAADNYFSGGTAYPNPNTQTIDLTGVANAAPQGVYQSVRSAYNYVYTFPALTAGTSYTVRLHFVDYWVSVVGGRTFNVTINGAAALTNFDVYATAGAVNRAVVRDCAGIADSNGNLTISFAGVNGPALVAGIEVINTSAGTAPSAPTGLTAGAGNAQVSLAWTAVSSAANYNVKRSLTNGSGYTTIATGVTTTSYTNTGLTNGTTYYYVVTAVNASGESANSNQASATPTAPANTALYQINSGGGAVGAFIADNYFTGGSAYTSTQTIDTTGVANAAPQAVYQSLRSTSSISAPLSYTLPGLTAGATYTVRLHFADYWVSVVGGRIFNVTINGAAALTNFDVYAAAGAPNRAVVRDCIATADSNGNLVINFVGVNGPALVAGIEVIGSGSVSAPSAPTGLTAGAGNAQVILAWTAVSGATSYNVKRSLTSGSGYTTIATGGTTNSYTDTGLTNGTTYYYVVTAVNSGGESANSNQASATPSASQSSALYQINSGGGAVGAFIADNYFTGGSAYTSTQTIDTTGVANAAPQAVYQSLRSTSSISAPLSYTLPGLTAGATYTVRLHFADYWVSVVGGRIFNVTINGAAALTNFDVYAAAGAPNRAVVRDCTATADSNGNLVINFVGVNGPALVAGIEIFGSGSVTAPVAPGNLTATAGNAQVSLAWTAPAGATSYNVKRSLTSGSGYTTVATGVTVTSYTDTGLTNGTTYYYVVTAVNSGGESVNSNQVSATPASQTALYQIHSGGGAVGAFIADNYFTGGSAYTSTQTIDTTGVANAAPQAVYQSLRSTSSISAPLSYTLPGLSAGATYTVRLHFADYWVSVVGGRIFNVTINGAAALTNFDVYAAAGAPNRAVVRDCIATADSNGNLVINFVGVNGPALIAGIEVLH